MKRRAILVAAVGLGMLRAPLSLAQTPRRVAILGVWPPDSASAKRSLATIREGLAGEGLSEGRDYAIDYTAEPRIDQIAARVGELLKRRPALLVAFTTPVAQAAAKATRVVPIVFGVVSDPVGSGLVASLARPGGNVTGVSNMLPALSGKLLELLRELVPGISRVAVLWNPDNPAKAIEASELRLAARRFGVALKEMPVRSLAEIERALAPGAKDRLRALVILAETLTSANRARIDELARANRMVVVSNFAGHADAGGVLSYSPDYRALNRRLGALAGKILAGAKPSDLPVELPATFELVVNRKSAKALGLAIPQTILLRADRVIE